MPIRGFIRQLQECHLLPPGLQSATNPEEPEARQFQSPGSGRSSSLEGRALDSDGDPVLYKFQVNGRDMNRWSESDSWRWSTKDLPAGDYKIRVLARDGRHAPEDSFDSALETAFALTTEIDQQIDLLMNQRGTKSSAEKDYHSSDIQVAVANDTNSKAILGKEQSGEILGKKIPTHHESWAREPKACPQMKPGNMISGPSIIFLYNLI